MTKKEFLPQSDSSFFNENIEKEWLMTNDLGGFSSSTSLGINTRKYHGLLVAALKPPGSRHVLLEKLDEDIILNKQIFRLGSNDFSDTIYPTGFKYIKKFSVNPYPIFIYENAYFKVEKSIFFYKKINGVAIQYNIQNKSQYCIIIRIFPLLNCRSFHTTTNYEINPLIYNQIKKPKEVILSFKHPKVNLKIYSITGTFIEKINQIRQIHYRKEKDRGESHKDDCFQPGYFEFKIPPQKSIKEYILAVSYSNKIELSKTIKKIGLTNKEIQTNLENSQKRQLNSIDTFYSNNTINDNKLLNSLLFSARNFIVEDNEQNNHIIAGYFWFGPWGRDTFISLPGLLLVTNRFKIAKNLLYNFSLRVKNGLIPNFQSDQNHEFAYNSVDASLWYINAVLQFLKYSGDLTFIQKKLWKKILKIINSYIIGTKYGIKLDNDGLLLHGSQLTWMDAIVEGKPVTPREGKAVEIQSLWYNALKITELLSNKFKEKKLAEEFKELSIKTKTSFNRKFFNQTTGCLFDVINKTKSDSAIRPNQIFSISLDFSILKENYISSVMKVVTSKLLTPFGLRTLNIKNPQYKGYYFGPRVNRDGAYHNGTVWPWLFGPYITAYAKTQKSKQEIQNKKHILVNFLKNSLCSNGLDQINEIFDGNFPHKPRGCISQAWSIAEPLRSYIEDILFIKPKYSNFLI